MPSRFSLLHFGWKSRARLPPPNKGPQLDPPDRQTILSQWQRLGSLDPKSRDYVELLRALVDVEGNRSVALKFTDDDAGIVINVIGDVLSRGGIQTKLACHTLSMLRKLAGNTGQVPDSYSVSKGVDYQVEKRIFACGGFADVRRGKLGKRVVAVKTIRTANDSDMSKIRKDFCKESVLWMHASHPNLLALIAINIDPQTGALSMISEMMDNGSIMNYIRVKEANRLRLLEDVTSGLRYLHACGIVHGDLKGSNILIKNGATPRACISDFGFSTFIPTISFVVPASVDEFRGTWSHMAPELLYPQMFGLNDARVSKQTDIYAFGIVVYEVLTGCSPFGSGGRRQAEIILRVIEGQRPSKPENAGDIGFGGGTWELTQQCWNQDRGKRPTIDKIRKHFHRVAGTSKVIPPGPTVSDREAGHTTTSEPDTSGSGNFTGLFVPLQTSTSIVQQVKFAANLMSGSGNVRPTLSVPSVHLVHGKPSLFDRLGTRIKGRGALHRLGAPPSQPVQT